MEGLIKSKKYVGFLSNLNLINILIGYPFIASIFIPILGDLDGATRTLTIPFRMFSLLISLITLLLNIRNKFKISLAINMFFLFWILVLLRILYDLEIRTDFDVPFEFKSQIWLFAIFICFVPMLSIYFSYKTIDFDVSLKYLFFGCIIILFISLVTTISNQNPNERIEGNLALDPISFAQISLTASLLSIYKFVQSRSRSYLFSMFYCIISILGIFIALKSGSRGPLLAFITVLIFWYVVKKKNKIIAYIVFLFFGALFFVLRNIFLSGLGAISPLVVKRFTEASDGEDMSMLLRQETYYWFINKILESPFLGSQFAQLSNTFFPGYAHNIFLDILLGLGIFGLILFLYVLVKAFIELKKSIVINNHFWVGLIMIQTVILSFTSGSYYSDPVLCCSILLVLMGNFYSKKDCKK